MRDAHWVQPANERNSLYLGNQRMKETELTTIQEWALHVAEAADAARMLLPQIRRSRHRRVYTRPLYLSIQLPYTSSGTPAINRGRLTAQHEQRRCAWRGTRTRPQCGQR